MQLSEHVVLGTLLTVVAHADGYISEEEINAKRAVLVERGYDKKEDQDEILLTSQEAIKEHRDWRAFTREINKNFNYDQRVGLISELFAIARADQELTNHELEPVQKIADLLWIEHKKFINTKFSSKPL